MSGIGDLVARLSVDNAPWKKGLQQSTGHMKSFVKGIGGLVKTGVVGALGLAAGGVFALNKQMGELDRLAKVSRNTGLGAETISAFGFAAEQSGGSVEGANKALNDFTRRMGDAASGNGAVVKAFEDIGLSMDSLLQMSPDEQLSATAQAISELDSPAQQAAASMALFGRNGQELTNLFAQGADGLEAFKAEARDLGLGFDSDELAKVEAANDAINRVKRGFGAMASTVAVEAAPAIESFFTWMTDTTKSFGGLGAIADTTFSFIGDSWNWLQDTVTYGITATMAIGEFAFTNWQEIAEFAFKSVGLAGLTLFNDVGYFFTDQVPGYLSWFSENWQDIFFTAFDFVSTGFINLGKNIENAWTSILDFITGSSDGLQFTWTPLMDGFQNTIKELPNIPPRAMTELEKSMQADVDSIGKGLGKSFDEIVGSRLDTLAEMQREASKPVKPALEATAAGGGSVGGGSGSDSASSSGQSQFAGVAQAGTAEAFSTLVKSMGGTSDSKKQTQLLQELVEQQKKGIAELKRKQTVIQEVNLG